MPAATKIPDKYKNKTFKFSFDLDDITMVDDCNYANNGRLRIDLMAISACPEPFGTLTVNLPNEDPGDDAFFVKTWAENESMAKEILAMGVFIDTGRRVKVGEFGCEAQIWKFAP